MLTNSSFRWGSNLSKMLRDLNSSLKWADGKLIMDEWNAALIVLLGPRPERDEQQKAKAVCSMRFRRPLSVCLTISAYLSFSILFLHSLYRISCPSHTRLLRLRSVCVRSASSLFSSTPSLCHTGAFFLFCLYS